MTDITPPPELFAEWLAEAKRLHSRESTDFIAGAVARLAYQAGADQELEACVDWVSVYTGLEHPELLIELLRAARRPKPISKAEALRIIDENIVDRPGRIQFALEEITTIRRALEALPE
jgi:hypothetical protein